MIRHVDEVKYKLYEMKRDFLFRYGAKRGLIKTYDRELLDNLRHFYYGGVPATILLLHNGLSNGHCYDRGPLITLGFGDDDFRVVDASVDSLRLNPIYRAEYRNGLTSEMYTDHCFAERTKKDGTTWVYDTSLGLVFEKNLYYKMQNPRVRKVNDKKATLEYLYEDFIRDSDIEKDKYALPLILPNIESNLEPTQPFYLEQLKNEIEILKQEIDYSDVCQEIHDDMKTKGFF